MRKILLIMTLAAITGGCAGKRGSAPATETKRVLTRSVAADSATVRLTEEFTSEIEPYRENDITPAASGVHIDRIWVEVGDAVRQGQLVVSLDPTQYTQQLVQLQTDYATLLEALHAKQRALTQLTETFQRQEETIEELRAELRARETKEAATIGEVRDSIALSGAPSFEVSEMPECGEVTVFVHEGQYGIHLWCDQTRSARSVGELQDVINEYESEVMAYQKNAELLEKEMARLMETEGSLKKRIWKMESLCKEFNTCLNDKEKELGACYKSLQQAASLLKKRGV